MTEGLWVLISFLALIILIYRPVKNAVVSMLDKNTAHVTATLEEAVSLKKEAQQSLLEKQQAWNKATQQSQEIIEKAAEASKNLVDTSTRNIIRLCEKKIEIAMNSLKSTEEQMLEEIKNKAVQQAVELIRKEVFEEIDRDSQMAILNSSLEKIKKIVH